MRKPTIVILHGWGLSGEKFLPLVDELKKRGYSVFFPDLPGFGSTEIPSHPLKLEDYARFLYQYLRENNIVEPVLIGHSFGGRVSLKYEKMYPKSVRALILSGTPGFTLSNRRIHAFLLAAKLGKRIFSLPILSRLKETAQSLLYYFGGSQDFYKAHGVMRETFKNIVHEELLSCMKRVAVPCLLIWGENDILVPIKVAYLMKTAISGSQLVIILKADHAVSYKQPKVFSDSVENFLKTI